MPASLDDVCAQDPKPKPTCLRGKKRGPERGPSGSRCVRENPEGRSQTQRPPFQGNQKNTFLPLRGQVKFVCVTAWKG